MSSAKEALFATTAPGLEGVLADEVRALGHIPQDESETGQVGWEAPAGGHQDANLRLRTAHRVLLQLAEVRAGAGTDWVESFPRAALRRVWDGRAPLRLEVVGAGTAGGQVSRAMRRQLGLDPQDKSDAHEAATGVHLQLRVARGRAQLLVDTSGEPLHRRGWRQEISRAPLRETLAAGLLALAGWRDDLPLWDGLCGSGTLVIEAALRARRRVPGTGRSFAFERWRDFDAAAWAERVARARTEETPGAAGRLFASDLHAGALGTARRNARRAGVEADLALSRIDLSRFERPAGLGPGLWLSNLPYGKRVGERGGLATLYRTVAETWHRVLPDWRVAFFVQDAALLEEAVGRPPVRRFPISNGGMRCSLMVWAP